MWIAIEFSSSCNGGQFMGVYSTRKLAVDMVNDFHDGHYVDKNGLDTWGDYEVQVWEVTLDKAEAVGI